MILSLNSVGIIKIACDLASGIEDKEEGKRIDLWRWVSWRKYSSLYDSTAAEELGRAELWG